MESKVNIDKPALLFVTAREQIIYFCNPLLMYVYVDRSEQKQTELQPI